MFDISIQKKESTTHMKNNNAAGSLLFTSLSVHAEVLTKGTTTPTSSSMNEIREGTQLTTSSYQYSGEKPILYYGNQLEAVKYLQSLLISKGYLKADRMTGTFDEPTRSAVKSFQRDAHINEFAIVADDTWAGLEKENPYQSHKTLVNGIDYGMGLIIGAEEYITQSGFDSLNRKLTSSTRVRTIGNQKYYDVSSLGNDISFSFTRGYVNVLSGTKTSKKSETVYPTIRAKLNGYDYGLGIIINGKTYLPQGALDAINSTSKNLKETIYYNSILYTKWNDVSTPLKAVPLENEKGYNFVVVQ